MKTILGLLLILCAFTSAHCIVELKWKNCLDSLTGWTVYSVSLDAEPVIGQNSTFSFCGMNYGCKNRDLKDVHLTSGTILDEYFPITFENPCGWDGWCESLTFQIPQTKNKTLPIHIDVPGAIIPHAICIDVNLTLSSNGSKFLEKFF